MIVATSVSGKKRSFTRRLIPRNVSSEMNRPPTRKATRSGPVSTKPDWVTAFCACSVAMIAGAVDAEGGDLAGGEFEVDHLVLRPDDVDLADVGDLEDLRSGVLGEIAQFPLAQSAVACKGKDVAIDVAELVVEEGADHALREIRA